MSDPNTPPPPPPPPPDPPWHPVDPRRPRDGVMHDLDWPDDVPFPSFRRRPKTPKAPKPPKGVHGTCMVGELLVPLFGRSWVDEVTAQGGLVPYLLRRRSPKDLGVVHDIPGGSTGDVCPKKFHVAAYLTLLAVARHWRELPALWRETGEVS